MSRYFLPLSLALALLAGSALAQPARGLIVKLRDAPASSGRERPQAEGDRLAAVAQGAGVPMRSQHAVGGRGHRLMRFATPRQGADLDAALRRMRLHPDVVYAEPDVLMKRLATPNDPGFADQWHLQTPMAFRSAINMPSAWDRTTGGNVVVAVLDTGVRGDHPDLAGRLLPGYDFVSEVEFANDGDGRDPDASDPGDWVSAADRAGPLFRTCSESTSSWHGTFIASQIAGLTDNNAGVAGINWRAQVLPVRVSGKCGAFLSDILDGMRWAAGLAVAGVPANPNPARVINLSFGGDVSCTASYQDTIDEVTNAGALVVVAAGNNSGALRRPADCRGVLAVGSVDQNGQKASYSNLGANLALMAPGGTTVLGATSTQIYSASNPGGTTPTLGAASYDYKSGTSFSAPLAAGVASLMLVLNPALPPDQLVARMRSGVRPHTSNPLFPNCGASTFTCNCTTATCGAGLLDADGALAASANPVALIADVGAPAPGASVALDGRASTAVPGGTIVSYQWSQTGGTTLFIDNSGSAQAAAVLPAQAGTFQFRLVVTDSAGLAGEDFVTVTTQAPPASGGGGGSMGWAWGAALWLLALFAARRRQALGGQWS